MGRKVKDKAFDDGQIGHNGNTDVADKETVKRIAELEEKRMALAGEIKDILNEHKAAHGTPKASIRAAVRILQMTAEQYQAKKEIATHTHHIVQLIANEDTGQFSFLKEEAA